MTRLFAVLTLVFLAACGADGEPITPTMNANVGVGSNGVSVGTNLGLSAGPVQVGVGLGL